MVKTKKMTSFRIHIKIMFTDGKWPVNQHDTTNPTVRNQHDGIQIASGDSFRGNLHSPLSTSY